MFYQEQIEKNPLQNKSLFLWGMVLASILPFIVGMAISFLYETNIKQMTLLLLVLVTPLGAHQVTTIYFYFDRLTIPVIRANLRVYVVTPILISLCCFSLMYTYGNLLKPYLLAFLSAWTIYHYQKQNVGIFALTSPLFNSTYMSPREKQLIILSGISGILAFGDPVGNPWFQNTFMEPLGGYAYWLSILLLVGVLSAFFYLCRKNFSNDVSKGQFFMRWGMLFLLLIFYVPLYFMQSPLAAFCMFASAHSLQYFFIMFFIASDGNLIGVRRISFLNNVLLNVILSLSFLVIMTVVLWKSWDVVRFHSAHLASSPLGDGLLGLAISFSFIHYYIDGKIWKMSNPKIRDLVRQKLHFLFS